MGGREAGRGREAERQRGGTTLPAARACSEGDIGAALSSGRRMSSSPYGMHRTPSSRESARSQTWTGPRRFTLASHSSLTRGAARTWKTQPITEYCRNQATREARPTVRNGAIAPSAKTIFAACESCPCPDTWLSRATISYLRMPN